MTTVARRDFQEDGQSPVKVVASTPAEFDAAFRTLTTDFLKFTHANAAEVFAGQLFLLEIFKREASQTQGPFVPAKTAAREHLPEWSRTW